MKANELRIGNYVTSKTWSGYHQIDGIERIDDEIFELKMKGYIHRYEKDKWFEPTPIPLTEDILLKLGFSKNNNGYSEDHEDYHEWYEREYPTIGWMCQSENKKYIFNEDDSVKIYYIHQLQNFYFAVLGQELEINLNEK